MPTAIIIEIQSRDEAGNDSCYCLPLDIGIEAVIRNVGSVGQFMWYMAKTTIGALTAIVGCLITIIGALTTIRIP